ncbi:ribonucleoside-diphosphate reductase subunit alpha [Comamonas sp. NLF-1-9]|uniref:ribonucleoside-diphosphate reductase subunit alpha n=1 Tax=Comamonas sp. NLF-1-9 TaxID=2853163 RepID=UPI001C488152|nr:ribonucleoside-diphosphate reductase subunit alpha [Comamonas sp. NLF-1-9]QXL84957.1 ribonucleoside-diphosphate reductase subunit alpha [Comamonas sp. NLF-1-9]
MIESVTKRDGRVEPFTPSKLNGWGEWAAKALGPDMDWSSVVLETVTDMPEQVTTTMLQQQLIKNCLQSDSWLYNRMAGRLYAALMHKEVHGVFMPTVLQLHRRLQKLGYMEVLDYSDEEYAEVEKLIDHDRDYGYAHYQLHTHLSKYAIADRVKNRIYETSQFIYMRMAMALAVDQPRERRMHDVARWYEHLSMNRINAPTPNHINLGTPLRGYASCCLYTTADSARSIAVGNHIAYTMTYMSAGIGSHMNIRSVNDPVRGGVIRHQGKLPYLRAVVSEVKSSLQNGRGGACTSYFSIYDPEIETLLRLKNPMSTEDKKIRGMDYSWGSNRLFARKVARNEEIFLFNSHTAPDLYEALYSNDEERFEQLYQKYEKNPLFPKRFVNARELLITACNEWNETGRIYEHNILEMNRHTPFKETIYSSNLCSEIDLPTGAYNHITEIYQNADVSFVEFEDEEGGKHSLSGEHAVQTGRGMVYPLELQEGDEVNGVTVHKIVQRSSPEVATCNLAGICVDNIESDAQYEEVAYYALLMIDKCIHLAEYELPHIGYTSKARLNAGVGILGMAHLMAREHQRYTTTEGKQFIHRVAERHFYHLVRASLRLGQELGNAPWMHKTRWPEGWMPLDTYNRNVDQIAAFTNHYDWEALRLEVVANGGIRNSVLAAHMPTETSANASGTTNGVYPIRELTMIKTDNQRVNYWAAPEGEELAPWYESAWNIPAKDMTEAYAIIQKWTDQGISADFYRKVIGDAFIGSSEMIRDYLYRIKMGLKSKYYMNQKTSAGFQPLNEAEAERKELVGRMVGSAMAVQTGEPQPESPRAERKADTEHVSVLDADPECNGSCTL